MDSPCLLEQISVLTLYCLKFMQILMSYFENFVPCRLTSTLLALKGETEGSYTSTDKTPSSVAKEFEHLFNQGCHRLRRALGSISERDGKSLANKLFKVY